MGSFLLRIILYMVRVSALRMFMRSGGSSIIPRWLRFLAMPAALIYFLMPLKAIFQSMPWTGVILLVGAIGWKLGRWRLALTVMLFVFFIASKVSLQGTFPLPGVPRSFSEICM